MHQAGLHAEVALRAGSGLPLIFLCQSLDVTQGLIEINCHLRTDALFRLVRGHLGLGAETRSLGGSWGFVSFAGRDGMCQACGGGTHCVPVVPT